VVGVLHLREGLAGLGLLIAEICCWGPGDSVEGNNDVVAVSVLVELDVTDFFVGDDCGVVGGDVAGRFGVEYGRIGIIFSPF